MTTRNGDSEYPQWDAVDSFPDDSGDPEFACNNFGLVVAENSGGGDAPDDPPVILVDGVEVCLDEEAESQPSGTTAATGALAAHGEVDLPDLETIQGGDAVKITTAPSEPRPSPLRSVEGFRGTVPASVLRDLPRYYDQDLAAYRAMLSHPRAYQRTVYVTPPERRTQADVLPIPDFLGTFYGASRETQRQHASRSVQSAGIKLISNPDMPPEDAARLNQAALDSTYQLVGNLRAVHTSKATFPYLSQMTGPQGFATRQGLDEINRAGKPPEIADFMRNHIPRYAWSPHSIPQDVQIPPDYAERFRQLWSGLTPADTSYLTLPSELEAGAAPLHIAMRAAKTAEVDGHAGLGYAVRTNLIIGTLRSETAKFDGLKYREIPYYRHLVPAALSGLLALPKGAHTDYRAHITETIEQTWSRLEHEISSGQPGPATTFLYNLVGAYQPETAPDIFPALAQSAVQYTHRSTFNLVEALRGLRDSGAPWAEALINHVAEQPNRPILTNQEACIFATEYVTPGDSTPAAEEVSGIATQLLEESDLFSFKLPLAEVASISSHANATIAVDITPTEATATIRYAENGQRLQVPVTMNLVDGTVSVNTIDTTPLDPTATSRYGVMVGNAILGLKATRDALAAEAAQAQREPAPAFRAADTPAGHPPVRAAAHIKTRGKAHPQDAALSTSPDTREAVAGKVTLIGLTADSVRQLLGSERIRDIDADSLVQKVLYLADRTNRDEGTGTPFGRRSGAVVKGHAVRLRQLNWITGQGHRQIRVYFREHDGGRLELCGILDKKGDAQQSRYMIKLADRLRREDQRRQR